MGEKQHIVSRHIGSLIAVSFRISNPLSQLHLVREKIIARGLKSFDMADIMEELGRLQHIAGELHSEMLRIDDLLKQEGH